MRLNIKVIIVVCVCVKRHSCSFQWKEPTLNYTNAVITGYESHLGLKPLEPKAMGSGILSYDVRYMYLYVCIICVYVYYNTYIQP